MPILNDLYAVEKGCFKSIGFKLLDSECSIDHLLQQFKDLIPDNSQRRLKDLAIKNIYNSFFKSESSPYFNLFSSPQHENLPPLDFISFNQEIDVIQKLDAQRHVTLLSTKEKYDGLCEIICNLVLSEDLLGKGDNLSFLRNQITPDNLDKDFIKMSHLLVVYNFFMRLIAYLFMIYPDNILSCTEQWQLTKREGATLLVDRQVLSRGMARVPNDGTLKVEVFSRNSFLNFVGHSLLIKKVSDDSFIFFDPNAGEQRGLSLEQLGDKLDGLLTKESTSDLSFIWGKSYLARLPR
jgi:hypothetical protein